MIKKIRRYLQQIRTWQQINAALSRGSATSRLRSIDLTRPASWEFSGFSQNGEDGIIDVLCSRLLESNRYFVEVGAGDGTENNTSWLAIARRFSGVWIEGDGVQAEWSRFMFQRLNYGLMFLHEFVDAASAKGICRSFLHMNPDVFSLDIDGNDYYVAKAFLEAGLRPKILVLEYNSAFGPDRKVTIEYQPKFARGNETHLNLYYGCSIAAWRAFATAHGYVFVGVEANGVNAFFVDPAEFSSDFINGIVPVAFRENFAQLREYGSGWAAQFDLIKSRRFNVLS